MIVFESKVFVEHAKNPIRLEESLTRLLVDRGYEINVPIGRTVDVWAYLKPEKIIHK